MSNIKLTNEQKKILSNLLIQGYSVIFCSKQLGVTRSRIYQLFPEEIKIGKIKRTEKHKLLELYVKTNNIILPR